MPTDQEITNPDAIDKAEQEDADEIVEKIEQGSKISGSRVG